MMTRRLRVRDARDEDLPDAYRIAAANGMQGWVWPSGCWGCVAVLDEQVVAFCCVREITNGWLVEELWQQPDVDGARGLSALSEWVETTAAHAAKAQGKEEMNIGGFVLPHNERHRAALEKRGYAHYADVLAKKVHAA